MQKDRIINYLSYDKLFGILTRPALELKIKVKVNVCLIDFNNMKKLNQLLGYNKVNEIIFNIFNEFKKYKCLCGRWFSGDEILIVDKNISSKILLLRDIAYKNGMSFKTLFINNKGINEIEKEIGRYKDRAER